MAKIPNHFKEAFPWIIEAPNTIKVSPPSPDFIERDIIRLIFRQITITPPDDGPYDPVWQLLNSLAKLKEEQQVSYTKALAKCLAEAVVDTQMRPEIKEWLDAVGSKSKSLAKQLKQTPKRNLPASYNNLFGIVRRVIDNSNIPRYTKLSKIYVAVDTERLYSSISKKINKTHGILDLVAILNFVSQQSKELVKQNRAILYHQFTHKFFEEISNNSKFRKNYQRIAIQSISEVNQKYFNDPNMALTTIILKCIFHMPVNTPNVKKIKKTTQAK